MRAYLFAQNILGREYALKSYIFLNE